MPNRNVRYDEPWELCDRCGFPHPRSYLTIQKGLKLCQDHGCIDNLDVELRARIIGDILQSEEERVYDVSENAEHDDPRF